MNPRCKDFTVLIPAFNQPEGALETVRQISLERHKSGIPFRVILSDNCSDDLGYIDLLETYVREGWLSILRQDRNLGFAANIRALAGHTQTEYAIVLGCGDLLDVSTLNDILREVNTSGVEPSLVVCRVVTHTSVNRPTFPQSEAVSLLSYSKFKSLWAPYQEAIPGQIFKTSILRSMWPSEPLTGNTWPHIEFSLEILRRKGVVVKCSQVVASMHQGDLTWYLKPGANLVAIFKHVYVLTRALPIGGAGVFAKLILLLALGIPSAALQDLRALKASRVNWRPRL